MKKLKWEQVQALSAYVCDRCGREAGLDDSEAIEFISIESVGGYQSIFGDGSQVSLDICQYCLKETLGEWLNILPASSSSRGK